VWVELRGRRGRKNKTLLLAGSAGAEECDVCVCVCVCVCLPSLAIHNIPSRHIHALLPLSLALFLLPPPSFPPSPPLALAPHHHHLLLLLARTHSSLPSLLPSLPSSFLFPVLHCFCMLVFFTHTRLPPPRRRTSPLPPSPPPPHPLPHSSPPLLNHPINQLTQEEQRRAGEGERSAYLPRRLREGQVREGGREGGREGRKRTRRE